MRDLKVGKKRAKVVVDLVDFVEEAEEELEAFKVQYNTYSH